MDTVTEARLAIAMAQLGGIGIIHKNMSVRSARPRRSRSVKKFEAGVIKEPFTVGPETTIGEVLKLTRARNISGVPVVDGGQLVGIVTSRDMRFEKKLDDPVRHIMTKKDRLVTVREGATDEEVAAAAAQAPHREGAGGQRRLRAARPDHRQGHPEEARQPQRRQGQQRAPAGRRRGRRRRRHRGARRSAGRRGRRRGRGRHRARPFAGRARPRRSGSRRTSRSCRSSAATSSPATRRWR